MILLDKITIKTVKSLPFVYPFFLIIVNYPIFSLNYHIISFQMYFQYSSFLLKYPNTFQILVTFCKFWNRSSHRNDCFWFLELFSRIYQAHSVRSSVWNAFFVRNYFRTVSFTITDILCLFSILFCSSVISTDIQKGIITNLVG